MAKTQSINQGASGRKVVLASTAWADSLIVEREIIDVPCPKFEGGGVTFTLMQISELDRLGLLRSMPETNPTKADWIEWTAEILMVSVIDKETKANILSKETALYLVMSDNVGVEPLVIAAIEISGLGDGKKKSRRR